MAIDVMVPMRNGVRLATDVYRPAREGTVDVRTSRSLAAAKLTGYFWSLAELFETLMSAEVAALASDLPIDLAIVRF